MGRGISIGRIARRSALLALLAAAIVAPGASHAAVTCSLDTGTAVLSVAATDDSGVLVGRSGDAIVVLDEDDDPIACANAPTVTNVDQISIAGSPDQTTTAGISLNGGALAPGLTPEVVGQSEIEISMTDVFLFVVIGSDDSDAIRVRSLRAADQTLANLDYRADSDFNVTLDSVPFLNVVAGGRGNDRIRFDGGFLNVGAGGRGNDLVRGSSGIDFFTGDRGNDHLFSGAQPDSLIGGGGADVINAGSGDDQIKARDGRVDRVLCGPGHKDAVSRDKRDHVHGCEQHLSKTST